MAPDSVERLSDALETHAAHKFPVLLDKGGMIARAYDSIYSRTTIIVDKTGIISQVHVSKMSA